MSKKKVTAGVDPKNASKDATRVAAPRPGEGGSQDPAEVVKAEDGDEGEDEDEEEEAGESAGQEAGEQEEEEEGEKSLTVGDLSKSLQMLEDFAKSGDAPSRKQMLLAKANEGDLSKSEREELFSVLGGGEAVADDSTAEAIVKSMGENDNLQKALDVSEYLQEQHVEMVKSLRTVGDEIQKSDHRRHEFNLILAKAVGDIGEMVKSLSETVSTLAGQPARGPKSLGVSTRPAQVVQRGFGGQPPVGENLTKSMVLDTMESMMEESMTKGMNGLAGCGEDLTLSACKYEQTNQISPALFAEVREKMKKSAA